MKISVFSILYWRVIHKKVGHIPNARIVQSEKRVALWDTGVSPWHGTIFLKILASHGRLILTRGEDGVSRLRAALKAAYLAGESPAPGIAYLPG
jgi:hypothetical protein